MNKKLFRSNAIYIIGLSGGPDSVYLLHQLVALRTKKQLTLIAAHLNHEWRASAENDLVFCKQLCAQLNVPLVAKRASELDCPAKPNGSKEEIGRKLRRYFFEEVAQEYKADGIVLAHHADDQLETFFIRLIRGSTIAGLSCMKEQNGLYLRPLLGTSKEEILNFLQKNNLEYVIDPTNESQDYLRNRIRTQVIPALKACDTRAENSFARTLASIQETEQFLQKLTTQTYDQLLDTEQALDFKKLLELDQYLQKRVVQHWLVQNKAYHTLTDAFLDEILRFLQSSQGGSHRLHAHWAIEKKQSKATIKKI